MPDLPGLPQLPPMPLAGGLPAALGMLFNNTPPSAMLQSMAQDMGQQFDASTQRVNQLINTANQFGGQYNQMLQQPMPMTDKWGDFAANLAGNISQAVAPQMNGQAIAQQTIQQGQQMATNQRLARLSALRDNYDRMANAAMEAGNTLEHTKFLTKAQLMEKQIDAENQAAIATGQQKTERDVAGIHARTAVQTANIAATSALAVVRENFKKSVIGNYLANGYTQKPETTGNELSDYEPPTGIVKPAEWNKSVGDLVAKARNARTQGVLTPELGEALNSNWKQLQVNSVKQNELRDPAAYAARLLGTDQLVAVPQMANYVWPLGRREKFGQGVPKITPLYDKTKVQDVAEIWSNIRTHYGDDTQAKVALVQAGVPKQIISQVGHQFGLPMDNFDKQWGIRVQQPSATVGAANQATPRGF